MSMFQRTLAPTRSLSVRSLAWVLCLALLPAFAPAAQAADHGFGIGALFYKTVDDFVGDGFDNIEEDGQAIVLSYRYEPEGIFFIEIDAEYYENGYGGATDGTLSPIVFLGVGSGWYAAVGIGANYSSQFQDNVSDTFWAGRIGLQKALLPGIALDINFNYRADAYEALEDASTDAINLGASIRFRL